MLSIKDYLKLIRAAIEAKDIPELSKLIFLAHGQYATNGGWIVGLTDVFRTLSLMQSLTNYWLSQFNTTIFSAQLLPIVRIVVKACRYDEALTLYKTIFKNFSPVPKGVQRTANEQQVAFMLAWCSMRKEELADMRLYLTEIHTPTFPYKGGLVRCYNYSGREYVYNKDAQDKDKAIECFKTAVEMDPRNPSYLFHQAYTCYFFGDKVSAQDLLPKAIELAKGGWRGAMKKIKFFEGELAMSLNEWYNAKRLFEEILSQDEKHTYVLHNLAIVNRSIGSFYEAGSYLDKAIDLYNAEWTKDEFKSNPNKCYFYAEAINSRRCILEGWQYNLIIALLKKYCLHDPEDPDGPGELAKILYAKKKAMDNGQLDINRRSTEKLHEREQINAAMLAHFDKSIKLFEQGIKATGNPRKKLDHYLQLGGFYLYFGMYSEAAEAFQQVLKMDPDEFRAMEGFGVASFKSGNYEEAIRQFSHALLRYEDSMNLRSNLADSYRCKGNIPEAEIQYHKVFRLCDHHIDALIGMGECKKNLGDKAVESEDRTEAEFHFLQAKTYFTKAAQFHKTEYSSKLLTMEEENGVNYSLAYCKVRLYELSKGLDASLLWSARSDLQRIPATASEYLKAQRVLSEVNRRLIRKPIKSSGAHVVFVLALLIFFGTQIIGIQHYLTGTQKSYSLNADKIRNSVRSSNLKDSLEIINSLSPVLLQKFPDINALRSEVGKHLHPGLISFVDMSTVDETEGKTAISIDGVTYSFFTFGSLVFIVIGLYLPAISRIKLGAIEMEKVSVDTVKTSVEKVIK